MLGFNVSKLFSSHAYMLWVAAMWLADWVFVLKSSWIGKNNNVVGDCNNPWKSLKGSFTTVLLMKYFIQISCKWKILRLEWFFFVQEKNQKKKKNSKDLANWWQSFWHMCLWPKKSLLEMLQASWNDSSWSDCWSELIAHIRINLKSHTKVIDSYLKIYVAFEQTEHVQFGFKTSFLY